MNEPSIPPQDGSREREAALTRITVIAAVASIIGAAATVASLFL